MSNIRISFIYLLLFSVLAFRSYYIYTHLPDYQDRQEIKFTTMLSEEPQINTGRQKFSLKTPDGVPVTVITDTKQLLHYGDVLLIDGKLTQKLYNGRILWAMYYPEIQLSKNENVLTNTAVMIKNKAKALYEGTLPPVPASLLLGMVFGGKQGMPEDFLQQLRSTGVLHVIAASGMNVSFVAGALMYMLGAVLKRQIALAIGIPGVIFYAFIAGFEPSIIRASIMAVLAFSASILGRQNFALQSVFLSAFVMLFWDPLLLKDVGFQLSFLSTLGILLVKPVFKIGVASTSNVAAANAISHKEAKSDLASVKKYINLGLLGEDVSTTVAAQTATLPVMFGIFGSYGLLSILVNALVLWTVPFLMVLGSLAVLAGFVFEPLARLFLYLSLPFLLYFEKVISFFGSAGWTVKIEAFPVELSVGYYFLLGSFVMFIQRRINARPKIITG